MNKEELFKKFLENNCSKEEMKELFEMIQKDDVGDYNQILESTWKSLDDFPELSKSQKQTINQNILSEIRSEKDQGQVVPMLKQPKLWYAVAASLLLLIAVSIVLNTSIFNPSKTELTWVEVSTQKGERKKVSLPDGSTVILNAQSSIIYPQEFGDYIRETKVSGEAFLSIKHNPKKPLIVKAGNTITTVLGTKFNVKALESDSLVTVSLVQGKVEVYADQHSKQAALLKPNQEWVYHIKNQDSRVQEFDINLVTGWKNNHFVFDFEPLSQVVRQLENHFGVKINIENPRLNNCQVKLNIKNASLKAILQSISYSNNIEYEINGANISLSGKGCP